MSWREAIQENVHAWARTRAHTENAPRSTDIWSKKKSKMRSNARTGASDQICFIAVARRCQWKLIGSARVCLDRHIQPNCYRTVLYLFSSVRFNKGKATRHSFIVLFQFNSFPPKSVQFESTNDIHILFLIDRMALFTFSGTRVFFTGFITSCSTI